MFDEFDQESNIEKIFETAQKQSAKKRRRCADAHTSEADVAPVAPSQAAAGPALVLPHAPLPIGDLVLVPMSGEDNEPMPADSAAVDKDVVDETQPAAHLPDPVDEAPILEPDPVDEGPISCPRPLKGGLAAWVHGARAHGGEGP